MKLQAILAMAITASVFSQYIVYGDDIAPSKNSGDVPEIYAGLPPQVKIELGKCNLKIDADKVFMDVETTGLSKEYSRIIEIVIFTSDGIFSTLVNPQTNINAKITEITGITNKDVEKAPIFPQIAEQVYSILEGKTIVGHNVAFDINMVRAELKRAGMELGETKSICTLKAERKATGKKGNSLSECLERHNIKLEGFHRAGVDVEGTVLLYNSQVEKGYFKEESEEKTKTECKDKCKCKSECKSKTKSESKAQCACKCKSESKAECKDKCKCKSKTECKCGKKPEGK